MKGADNASYWQGVWQCVGTDSGTVFPEVDLSEGEWVDYDEKVMCSRILTYYYTHPHQYRLLYLLAFPPSRASGAGRSGRKRVMYSTNIQASGISGTNLRCASLPQASLSGV